MKKHAVIDSTGQYRYQLLRQWDKGMPMVLFIMLNPSTADADNDDPTITRCINFAKAWGFGGLMVGNLWAYRATNPNDLEYCAEISDEFGPKMQGINDAHIVSMANQCELVIFAWGSHKYALEPRVKTMISRFPEAMAVTISKFGKPCHPLYLNKTLMPFKFKPFPETVAEVDAEEKKQGENTTIVLPVVYDKMWEEIKNKLYNKPVLTPIIGDEMPKHNDHYERMLKYAGKYQISIQFWGESNTNVFIEKDGIDLINFGGYDPEEAIEKTVEYLDRINGKKIKS